MMDQLESLSIAEQAADREFVARQDQVMTEIEEALYDCDCDYGEDAVAAHRLWLGIRPRED